MSTPTAPIGYHPAARLADVVATLARAGWEIAPQRTGRRATLRRARPATPGARPA